MTSPSRSHLSFSKRIFRNCEIGAGGLDDLIVDRRRLGTEPLMAAKAMTVAGNAALLVVVGDRMVSPWVCSGMKRFQNEACPRI